MERIHLSLIVFISICISFVSLTHGGDLKPETVYRIVYTQESNEWYIQQAKLWKIEVEKNPKNADAWFNYYKANRYANWPEGYSEFSTDKQTRLNQIVANMGKAVPNSYEYNYLKFFNSDEKRDFLSYGEKAYNLQPDKPDIYYEFIVYYLLNDEEKKAHKFLEKLYESKDVAPGLVDYNYNVLMSTDKNAILFTNGDNDTYPCWMLQVAKRIRTDVTVMNIHMIRKRTYLKKLLDEKNLEIDVKEFPDPKSPDFTAELTKLIHRKYPKIPIYFALTVYASFTESISDDLYLVGLAYKYSPTRIDNVAMLKNNWENNLRLDYLNYDWYSENYVATETIQKMLNQNYIAPAVMLYEHYKISRETAKAEKVKQLALEIAKPAGKESEVMEILIKK
jgi:hypothetical protein